MQSLLSEAERYVSELEAKNNSLQFENAQLEARLSEVRDAHRLELDQMRATIAEEGESSRQQYHLIEHERDSFKHQFQHAQVMCHDMVSCIEPYYTILYSTVLWYIMLHDIVSVYRFNMKYAVFTFIIP